jgi:dihydrofolate reductase
MGSMGKLVYMLNVSLDGYVETPDHSLDWSLADDELHSWFTEYSRGLGAELYGRRLWELMAPYWGNPELDSNRTESERDFGRLWRATPKIVFSSTLESVEGNARLVNGDVGEELARARTEFDGDLGVGGPTLAHQFVRRGLVDVFGMVVHPVMIGAGTPYFPPMDEPIRMRLTDTHRFDSGVVYLGYEADR